MDANERIIGIDLGTTNSVVAVTEGGEPIVIHNQEGANKTPSVVAFLDDNDCIVGEIARRQATTNPLRTISSIKRLMGVQWEDIEDSGARFPFEVVENDGRVFIDVEGMGYTPEQISGLILRKLKESAEAYLGGEVNKAVITVPAHFDDYQRNATMDAAKLAGLEVLRLINEPTAAALAYGFGKSADNEEIVAVYDFGGGTFDITILEINGRAFEVLTSTGDTRLGGDDLDDALVQLITQEFMEDHGVDLAEDPVTLRRLKEVCEKAKCELSTTTSTMIALPFIAYRNGSPVHLERQLTREEFEDLIEPFVNRTIRCCKSALEEAGLNKRDIKKAILVGGSTRIPLVQDLVEDFFGTPPFKGVNPDEVVALGAAAQAGIFTGNIEEVVLIDVAPHSLGIEVKDGKFSPIIEKNVKVPYKAAKNFTTTEENQTFVVIHVLQGESEDAAQNRSLGKFMLTDIPAQPRGRPRIRVTFFVNADGVMEISAEDLGSGAAKSLTIVHSDLDEKEKGARKRARGKRRDRRAPAGGERVRESDRGSKRYAPSGGTELPRRGGGSVEDSEVRPQGSGRGRGSVEDSDVRPQARPPRGRESSDVRPSQDFAVLGDTNPGVAQPAPVHRHSSADAHPLPHIASSPPPAARRPAAPQPPAPQMPQPTPPAPRPAAQAIPPPARPVAQAIPPSARPFTEEPTQAFSAPPRYGQDRTPAELPRRPMPSAAGFAADALSDEHMGAFGPEEPTQFMPNTPEPTVPMRFMDPPTDNLPPARESTQVWDRREEMTERVLEEESDEPPVVFPQTVATALARSIDPNMARQAGHQYFTDAYLALTEGELADDTRFEVREARIRLLLAAERKIELSAEMEETAATLTEGRARALLPLADAAVDRLGAPEVFRRVRAMVRFRAGELEGACEDMEVAAKADPHEGDRETLEEFYRARIGRGPDPAAQFKLVRLFLKANRVDEAIEHLQDLVHDNQYETRALKILGLCHWQKNLHFLAWQKFKQLRQTDEIREILYRLGTDMETGGQLQNAIQVYEHVLKESPDYRDVAQKLKKLRYRMKIQDEEHASSAANVLTDPRFTIIEEINRGSMGIIYKAQDKTLDEVVALKVLNDYLCTDPSAVERFKREARAAKKLAHPYIVRIHDMFESGSKRFISMEFIDGTDLKRMLADHTRFDEDQLIYYFLQLCDALSYAHKLNVIHRDIKPANIMITTENQVKVTDFGIAKILKGDDSTKSGTAVIGTPLYMAPEQITGEGVDARSDIYALGIMMYELISGQPPFYLGNIEYHHIHTPPPPLPESVSPKLRHIIMKCVEKQRENRYQKVEEIYKELRAE